MASAEVRERLREDRRADGHQRGLDDLQLVVVAVGVERAQRDDAGEHSFRGPSDQKIPQRVRWVLPGELLPVRHLLGKLVRLYWVSVYDGGDAEYLADSGGKDPSVWQRVREYSTGERECPYAQWDPAENEDREENIVTESDTWYGEHPGKWCRLCEGAIGEEHGYLYLGEEPNEVVYLRLVATALPSTINEPNIEEQVRDAFETSDRSADADLDSVDTFYEHGQWWLRADFMTGGPDGEDDRVERTFSVVDVEIAGGQYNFDFEKV